MAILVCRVAWMLGYESDKEEAEGGGRHGKGGWNRDNVPHESLNFLPIDDTYYGFVQNRDHNININKLGAQNGDESISGVSVVFCAENPESRRFLVTGWYSDATVWRTPFRRPEQDPQNRHVYFTATNATLIDAAERRFPIPRTRDGNPFGGIGMHNIWYGLNDAQAETFRQSLFAYMETPSLKKSLYEERNHRRSPQQIRDAKFRPKIIDLDGMCVISGETTEEALDAAHIIPAAENGNEIPENGITLRADIHRLYDRRMFRIHPETGQTAHIAYDELSEDYIDLLEESGLPDATLQRVSTALHEVWPGG